MRNISSVLQFVMYLLPRVPDSEDARGRRGEDEASVEGPRDEVNSY
jgi:hypothetical protein